MVKREGGSISIYNLETKELNNIELGHDVEQMTINENVIDIQITEYENHISKYRKDFHLDESWESIISKFQGKRILTREIVDAFVSEIKIYPDKNMEVKLYYDDMLDQLVSIADVREAECNGR